MTDTPNSTTPTGWRARLSVHPAAKLFPRMSAAERRALGEDIKKNGLQQPIALFVPKEDEGKLQVLDGVNRLDAMEAVGLPIFGEDGLLSRDIACSEEKERDGFDPFEFVVSRNLRRRHLAAVDKRKVVAALLKARSEWSDRAIARAAKVDHKTVGAERAANGEIPHKSAERKEASGRSARGRKPAAAPRDPGSLSRRQRDAVEINAKGGRVTQIVVVDRDDVKAAADKIVEDLGKDWAAKLGRALRGERDDDVLEIRKDQTEIEIARRLFKLLGKNRSSRVANALGIKAGAGEIREEAGPEFAAVAAEG